MIEILPLEVLQDEESDIFGKLNVELGKIARIGFPVERSIVVNAPALKLKSVLEHYQFGSKEIFEQSLTFVKKELKDTPVPEILTSETRSHKNFWHKEKNHKNVKELWLSLLDTWLGEIRQRLWQRGFYEGLSQNLSPQVVNFVGKIQAFGTAFIAEDMQLFSKEKNVAIKIKNGKLHPSDLKKLEELIINVNKKLLIPYIFDWVLDGGIKLTNITPFTPSESYQFLQRISKEVAFESPLRKTLEYKRGSTVRVFLNLSIGFTVEKNVDGVYISSEKIFDLNKPRTSTEDLIYRLVESATTFPSSPILLKLADMSEGMGKVRGAMRLLHQKSLLDPLLDAVLFARNKKGLRNINIVIPFVRQVSEFIQMKRELAVKKLIRKNSFKLFLEVAVPENILELEEYILGGLDGIVFNLDELLSHLRGFDYNNQELLFYNKEVRPLIKFLEEPIKILRKVKIPFIGFGNLTLNPDILEFLVENGVFGVVIERYEVHSMVALLNQVEKRVILRRAS